MLPNFNHLFPSFSPESRVWIYASNRELTSEEVEIASTELSDFVTSWNAHGKALNADASVLFSDILTVPDAMGLGLYFQNPVELPQHIHHSVFYIWLVF